MKALIALAALAFVGFGAASAGDTGGSISAPQQVRVQRDDLDLTRTQDAQVLLSRLDVAAERVCASGLVDHPSSAAQRAIAVCRNEAIEQIVARLDAPEVALLYAARDR